MCQLMLPSAAPYVLSGATMACGRRVTSCFTNVDRLVHRKEKGRTPGGVFWLLMYDSNYSVKSPYTPYSYISLMNYIITVIVCCCLDLQVINQLSKQRGTTEFRPWESCRKAHLAPGRAARSCQNGAREEAAARCVALAEVR